MTRAEKLVRLTVETETETEMMVGMKKGRISEEDVSLVLQRYTATTILALLQEVAQFPGVKINWNALVKKTSTGISSAREYQMLWRHLAYHDTLVEKLEDGIEPLDDDSDLEFELEAFPAVSSEALTEAAACAKVLIASGLPTDSGSLNCSTVEAPLTINIPNGQASRALSDNPQLARSAQGMNITVPVSVQKQPLPTISSAERLDGFGSAIGGLPARRKRKTWTEMEDMELIAAVQKCGEGNWANILKGDFKHDRTASQLSQRWAILRKKKGNTNLGNTGNPTSSALSEAQLATRQAVSIALNMPMMGSLSAACSVGAHSTFSATPTTEASAVMGPPSEVSTKSQQASVFQRGGTSNPPPKSRVTQKKTSSAVKPSPGPNPMVPGPNPMVKAAAVAAGARIATPSTAASIIKATQSRNVVHIRPGGGPLVKPSIPGGTNPLPINSTMPRPSNVHYIRTGITSPPPVYSSIVPSIPRPSNGKLAAGQVPPASLSTSSSMPAQQVVHVSMSASSNCISTNPCGNDESKTTVTEATKNQTVVERLTDLANMKSAESIPPVESPPGLANTEVGQDITVVNSRTVENQTANTDSPHTEVSGIQPVIDTIGENQIAMDKPGKVLYVETGECLSAVNSNDEKEITVEQQTDSQNTGEQKCTNS